jgi:Chromate resistance exported protein
MTWMVFSYSLPSKVQSSRRVALWRRLRRLGAISPTGGIHVLPARDECLEAFQWLAQEVQQAKGEALVMHVEQFEGLADADLIERFRQARAEDYATLDAQAAALEELLGAQPTPEERSRLRERLERLRRQQADIARIDFFDAPEGNLVASRLVRIAQAVAAGEASAASISPAAIEAYRDRRWVTRPRPHVDRLACIWLIRRFINPAAAIRYAQAPEADEVAFDMREGTFGHQGNLCTFENHGRRLWPGRSKPAPHGGDRS